MKDKDQKLIKRVQLYNCVLDLAKRAEELEEMDIHCVLYTLAGSIVSQEDNELAFLTEAFSRIKIAQIKKQEQFLDNIFNQQNGPSNE